MLTLSQDSVLVVSGRSVRAARLGDVDGFAIVVGEAADRCDRRRAVDAAGEPSHPRPGRRRDGPQSTCRVPVYLAVHAQVALVPQVIVAVVPSTSITVIVSPLNSSEVLAEDDRDHVTRIEDGPVNRLSSVVGRSERRSGASALGDCWNVERSRLSSTDESRYLCGQELVSSALHQRHRNRPSTVGISRTSGDDVVTDPERRRHRHPDGCG